MKVEFKIDCAIGAARYKAGTTAIIDDETAVKLIDEAKALPVDEESAVTDRSVGLGEVKPRKRAKK